jgi:hypothetical protein
MGGEIKKLTQKHHMQTGVSLLLTFHVWHRVRYTIVNRSLHSIAFALPFFTHIDAGDDHHTPF